MVFIHFYDLIILLFLAVTRASKELKFFISFMVAFLSAFETILPSIKEAFLNDKFFPLLKVVFTNNLYNLKLLIYSSLIFIFLCTLRTGKGYI